MNVVIEWLLEDKIISLYMSGRMPEDEMQKVAHQLWKLIDESDAESVHIVGDTNEVDSVSITMKSLTNLIDVVRHPRLGWILTHGKVNQVKSLLSTMINQLTPVKHRRFHTYEDCLEFLVANDTSLPPVNVILNQDQASK